MHTETTSKLWPSLILRSYWLTGILQKRLDIIFELHLKCIRLLRETKLVVWHGFRVVDGRGCTRLVNLWSSQFLALNNEFVINDDLLSLDNKILIFVLSSLWFCIWFLFILVNIGWFLLYWLPSSLKLQSKNLVFIIECINVGKAYLFDNLRWSLFNIIILGKYIVLPSVVHYRLLLALASLLKLSSKKLLIDDIIFVTSYLVWNLFSNANFVHLLLKFLQFFIKLSVFVIML